MLCKAFELYSTEREKQWDECTFYKHILYAVQDQTFAEQLLDSDHAWIVLSMNVVILRVSVPSLK